MAALVLGFCLLIGSAGALATAGLLSWADADRRDGDYLTTDETSLRSDSHALAVEKIDLNGLDGDWILGDARLRATSQDPDAAIFVGIARAEDAADFLHDVTYTTVVDVDDSDPTYVDHIGTGRSVDVARSGRHLGRPSQRHRHPEPHLDASGRQLDRDHHERRRFCRG